MEKKYGNSFVVLCCNIVAKRKYKHFNFVDTCDNMHYVHARIIACYSIVFAYMNKIHKLN